MKRYRFDLYTSSSGGGGGGGGKLKHGSQKRKWAQTSSVSYLIPFISSMLPLKGIECEVNRLLASIGCCNQAVEIARDLAGKRVREHVSKMKCQSIVVVVVVVLFGHSLWTDRHSLSAQID